MLARIVLVLSLSMLLTTLALVGYLFTTPRARWATTQRTPERLDADIDDSPEFQREINVADPLDVLDRLPATLKPKLEPSPTDADARLQSGEPGTQSSSEGASPAPRLLPAHSAQRLDAAIAPNRPGALKDGASQVVQASAQDESDIMTVMRALHDPARATTARYKLTALGFAPNHIELARRFTASDANERVTAVRSLPSIRGIVARDWFLWASRDADAEVRRAALALMASSEQPDLMARIEEMSATDSDVDIRASARRSVERLRQRSR